MTAKPQPEGITVLLIEDDPDLGEAIVSVMGAAGIRITHTLTLADAEAALQRTTFDVVVADWTLPDGDPIGLIQRTVESEDPTQFIVMTGQNKVDRAVQAVKAGAEQFLVKPLDFEALRIVMVRLARKSQQARAAAAARSEQIDPFGPRVADAERARSARIARQPGHLIIAGETGSGKGVLARWIHAESRRSGPFVSLNCAGLNPELLESELFGHERGAFTGANQRKRGLLELARGGTLFLDELGEMPRTSQAKILKAVEDGWFRRVGGTQEVESDARIIGASHSDLSDPAVLRSDLYYRLATYRLVIPPLRERRHAIDAIATEIVRTLRPGVRLAPDAIEALRAHDWPGNIRELRNVLERSVSLLDGSTLKSADLEMLQTGIDNAKSAGYAVSLTLADVESAHINHVVRHCAGNLSQAARMLGISRTTLYKKLASHERFFGGAA